MFRFTIRDVLWLTVVAAMGVCWLIEHRHRLLQAEQAGQRQAIAANREQELLNQIEGWRGQGIAERNHLGQLQKDNAELNQLIDRLTEEKRAERKRESATLNRPWPKIGCEQTMMRFRLRTLRFDLKYLFGETLLVALSLGAFRFASLFETDDAFSAAPFVFVGIITSCAAFGGLFLRPIAGAIIGLALAGLITPLWAVARRGIGV
jgi:hypothetical protein